MNYLFLLNDFVNHKYTYDIIITAVCHFDVNQ
jgi:hypothetical protein